MSLVYGGEPIIGVDASGNTYALRVNSSGQIEIAQLVPENDEYATMDVGIEGEVCIFRTADGLQVTGPCRILGYVVTTATASGPIEVEDGLTAGAGSDKFHIPASTAVGVYTFGGVGIKVLAGAFLNFVGATGSVALIVALGAGAVIAES